MMPSMIVAKSRGWGGLNFLSGAPEVESFSRPPIPGSIEVAGLPGVVDQVLAGLDAGLRVDDPPDLVRLAVLAHLGLGRARRRRP